MHLAIYHCRRECRLAKKLRKFLRKFFSQYTTARENAVLTKILKNSFCLPTIPPRKKIQFCRKFSKILFVSLLYHRGKNLRFGKSLQKFLWKFFSSLYTHGKGKNSTVFIRIHTNFTIVVIYPHSKLLGEVKSQPPWAKIFLLTLKPREVVKIKDFENFFISHL